MSGRSGRAFYLVFAANGPGAFGGGWARRRHGSTARRAVGRSRGLSFRHFRDARSDLDGLDGARWGAGCRSWSSNRTQHASGQTKCHFANYPKSRNELARSRAQEYYNWDTGLMHSPIPARTGNGVWRVQTQTDKAIECPPKNLSRPH